MGLNTKSGIITACVSFFCLLCSIWIAFTIYIVAKTNRNHQGVSTLPVLNFLVVSILQLLLVAPCYVYKKFLDKHQLTTPAVCDAFRFSYFVAEHMIKLSLVVISFDRLLAIRFTYQVSRETKRRLMILAILLSWTVVIGVDVIPFLYPGSKCTYNPPAPWSIAVIVGTTIVPFCLIAINYLLLWKLASVKRLRDISHRESGYRIQSLRRPTIDDDEDSNTFSSKSTSSYQGRGAFKRKLRFMLELKATKTSIIVLLTYLVCWGPVGVYYTIDNFCCHCLSSQTTHGSHYIVSIVLKSLGFLSSLVTPAVYCWRTKNFRKEVLKTICRQSYNKRHQTISRKEYYQTEVLHTTI